ncbi:MAG: ATP-binding domain-containing protein, partial [Leptolyngbya sp. SIO1D8]|nr:ATP-binding domain-containing protein [Leptolyngbya sp. SIO1D8]
PFCARPAMSSTSGATFSSRAAMAMMPPIVRTPVPPTPVTAMFQLGAMSGRSGTGSAETSGAVVRPLLRNCPSLTKKRRLVVNIGVATFAPAWASNLADANNDYPILTGVTDIGRLLESQAWKESDHFEALISVIQSVTSIRKRTQRGYVQKVDSRGAKLKSIEDSIANLDRHQSAAVIETAPGVQRIRGLAGSGKTIVLALKVAYLHTVHPEWMIAVTFNTRSLKGQFKHFINLFTIDQKNEPPDWDRVKIIHAWGSPKSEGIYYEFCKKHGIEYRDFNSAKKLAFNSVDPFGLACEEALEKTDLFEQYYDAILVDEAQDFSKSFLRLCYEIIKPGVESGKRLIYAYDELQNLNRQIMESPESLFGSDGNGRPRVQLQNRDGEPKQDIILNTCYRNSRPILSSAHSLGFGIYREEGLVQMFEYAGLWRDIGYNVVSGALEDGSPVKLERTGETSPKFLESHSDIDDLIQFKVFEDHDQQSEWLANEIEKNIHQDELKLNDVMVIHTNPLKTRTAVGKARELLLQKGINSNLAGVTTSPDDFFDENAVIFTSINRAKGNEAAMIYVMDADECFSGSELARKRNILFTAMTRSKAWLRVTGCGEAMSNLVREFAEVKRRNFALEFTYPTEKERRRMNLVNRDMSPEERSRINQRERSLIELAEALSKGEIHKEDFSPEVLEKLKGTLF